LGNTAAQAIIDLDAIAHNVGVVRSRSGADVMAVVKADGYGHGAAPVAHAALHAGATEVGVATIAEAVSLRSAGVTAPVIAWLHTPSADFEAAVRAGVEVIVSSPGQLTAVVSAAASIGQVGLVGVKIDTGLARSGIARHEWEPMCAALARHSAAGFISVGTAMTHLARGDEPDHPLNDVQAGALDQCVTDLRKAGLPRPRVHVSNSAAALTRPDLSRDLVRSGIAVYGCTPAPHLGDFGLVPAMTLTAEVSLVKRLAAGQGVSYSHTWLAPQDTTVAVIPCGYADGIPRVLSQRLDVWIGGRRYRSVGRVCMDQLIVDLGPTGNSVTEGDTAVLFGTGAAGEATALEWANRADTINYEIVAGIGSRCQRRYVGVAAANIVREAFPHVDETVQRC